MSQENLSRRSFFSKVVIGGAATAAAAVAATVTVGRKPEALAQAGDATKPAGYRETEHVKAYYRSTQV